MKVLIVEDERRAARAIGRMVNQHPAFSVAAMALNGQEAVAWLQENTADLVITDIRMPLMSGVQLMEILHRDHPNLPIVVLSGYSQFDYAKAALQSNAFDYLLKPVSQEDLFRVLNKVQVHLESRSQNHRRQLLQKALLGDAPTEETDLRVHIAVVRSGEPKSISMQDSFWNLPEQAIWLQQCFGSDDMVFTGLHNNERLLFLDSSQPVKLQIEQYYHKITAQSDLPIHLIYTQLALPPEEIHEAVKQLRLSLALRMRLFESQLFCVDDRQPLPEPKSSPLKDMHPDRAVEAICTQNRLRLSQSIRDMLTTAEEHGSLVTDVEAYLTSILGDARIAYQVAPSILSQTKMILQDAISSATDPEQCTEKLTNLLYGLLNTPTPKRSAHEVVDEIAQQIESSYHLPLSADALAKQYSITPAYLNKIFKQYKGVRPSEYLLNLRMERAREMLETMPDVLVKDVANSVGYSDPYYFSKVFNRTTGLWPTECQKKK